MKREFALVDELGALRARIAVLKEEEKALVEGIKQQILALDGSDNGIDGLLFRATLSCSIRETLDAKGLRADHPKLAAQYTNVSPVETVRVVARKPS